MEATFTSDRSLGALKVLRKEERLGEEGADALVQLLDEMDQRSTARFDQVVARIDQMTAAERVAREAAEARFERARQESEARLEKAIAELKSADRTRALREWTQLVTFGLTGLGIVVAVAIAIAKMLH